MRFQQFYELLAQRFQLFLPFFINDVDFRVVGDGLQGNVGHAFIHEAQLDVVVGGLSGRRFPAQLRFLDLSFLAVGHEIIRVTRAHDTGACQRQRHTGGVDGYPAASPLFSHIGRGAGTAGGVENEIAGISGHEKAALNNFFGCLHNINFCGPK